MRHAIIIIASFILGCTASDPGNDGDETGGPSAEAMIAECEGILACMEEACGDERAAIEEWQGQFPMHEQTCWEEMCSTTCDFGTPCYEDCSDPGKIFAECDDAYFTECLDACEAGRDAEEAAWQEQSDANFEAMRACEQTCYEAPNDAEPACGIEPELVPWCPILYATEIFEWGDFTCEGRLSGIFG